jgi:putative addiction module CopG family antidote
MAVEQMNISISPQMAKFIRSKVTAGGYTNISEVIRTAVRRMQEEEAREARLARLAADEILDELTDADKASIRERVQAGFVAIESGEYIDYVGREGLGRLAAGVKSRGRKLRADRASRA